MENAPAPRPARHAPHLRRRVDAVARLLAGEPVETIAEELGVTPRTVDAWAKEFCRAGETRLRQLPDNGFERLVTAAEKLVPLATLLSVVIAAVLFVQGQRKEAAERAQEAVARAHADATAREARVRDDYTALDDKYIEFVKLCLDHKDLDVFDTPLVRAEPPTADQRRQEAMVIAILQSILERAYLMYGDPNDAFERNQWSAWSAYMKAWSARDNFRAEWSQNRTEFDPAFAAYMDAQIAATPPSTRPTP
jgi:hypothetical protein